MLIGESYVLPTTCFPTMSCTCSDHYVVIVVADQSVASCYYLFYIAMCLTLLLQSAPATRLMLVAAGHSGSGPCITLHIMRCSTADPDQGVRLIQYCTGRSFLQAPASIQTRASRPTLEPVLDQFFSAALQKLYGRWSPKSTLRIDFVRHRAAGQFAALLCLSWA